MIIRDNDTGRRAKILKNLLKDLGFEDIISFQKANKLNPDGIFGMKSYAKLYELLLSPKTVKFSSFIDFAVTKKQIVLHHSVSGDKGENMFAGWEKTSKRVATAVGLGRDGTLYKAFDESKWAYHLGLRTTENLQRNKESIGIELLNWGYLHKTKEGFLTDLKKPFEGEVYEFDTPFRGQKYFELYPQKQIDVLKNWILLNAMRYNIPLSCDKKIFEFNPKAIQGEAGIYTHCSFRKDKLDIVPQPAICEMLYSLKNYEL